MKFKQRPEKRGHRNHGSSLRALKPRLFRTPVGQKLSAPFGRSLAPDRWVFVVGCYNSGTELLEQLIASHPEISGLPLEGVALTDALPRPEECGWTRLWYKCPDRIRLEPGEGQAARDERAKRQWSFHVLRDATNIPEKSVANTARIPFLQTAFPAGLLYS